MAAPTPDEEQSNAAFRRSFLYAFGLYSGVGLQLAVAVVAGLVGGKYADENLGTSPFFLLAGIILGTTAGFYNLVRILNSQNKKNDDVKHL